MPDLTTTYLGLTLKNPIVASASPLSERVETVRKLEEAGTGAVVMYSLFEEQIIHESLELDHYLTYGTDSFAEALSYLPDIGRYSLGPEKYLDQVYALKNAVGIPVIGSLNGVSTGGWIEYAKKIEEAGADALELNIYYLPFNPQLTSAKLEQNYIELIRNVKAQINIPLAVKLGPYFTGLANVLRQFAEAGADGLVLFNRFYQPDFDLGEFDVVPNLKLSTSDEMRMPLRWIALLYGQVQADFALTTGIHTGVDAVKAVMAGANVAMMASELLKNGPGRVAEILAEFSAWMEENEYDTVEQMRGSMSARSIGKTNTLRRANYIQTLNSFRYLP
ncbi:MAG: dihydroorotate dehydrogenase-like protein [Chloroflexota bacterium]